MLRRTAGAAAGRTTWRDAPLPTGAGHALRTLPDADHQENTNIMTDITTQHEKLEHQRERLDELRGYL
jgi:hypothetical protein